MERGPLLVGVIVLLIFVLPIAWAILRSNKKVNARKSLIKRLCESNGILADTSTQIGNALLGLDTLNKKLFYTCLQNIESNFKVISLDGVTSLNLIEENYPSKKNILHVNIAINTAAESHLLSVYDDQDSHLVVTDPKACSHAARQWIDLVRPQLL